MPVFIFPQSLRRHLIPIGFHLGILAMISVLAGPATAEPNFSAVGLSANTPNERPTLLKGLSASKPDSSQQLKLRLEHNFKYPLKDKDLRDALIAQGFKVASDSTNANYEEAIYPCFYMWNIFWTTDTEHNVQSFGSKAVNSCG